MLDQPNPLHNSQISKHLGHQWKMMTRWEKQPYMEEAKRLAAEAQRRAGDCEATAHRGEVSSFNHVIIPEQPSATAFPPPPPPMMNKHGNVSPFGYAVSASADKSSMIEAYLRPSPPLPAAHRYQVNIGVDMQVVARQGETTNNGHHQREGTYGPVQHNHQQCTHQ